MAITSKAINLVQLDSELGSKGLIADLTDPKKKIIFPSELSDVTEAQLEAAISSHVAIDEEASKATQKAEILARLGITAEEAKVILS